MAAAPVDPASSAANDRAAARGAQTNATNLGLEMSEGYNDFMTSNPADLMSGD